MHQPYQEILKHPYDFVVKYRFFSQDEGGRSYPPVQGLRLDFSYADKGLNVGGVSMIWPEFEDESGNVIVSKDTLIAMSGTARMWVISPERRPIHQECIRIGTKAYFMEGKPVAECEVIEIVGLLLYRTQVDNWFKIKVIKGNVLQVVEPPSEKAFPFGSRLVFKGL